MYVSMCSVLCRRFSKSTAKLSELDGAKSVFYYKLGSLDPPDDFEDLDTESSVESLSRRHV